ncbi:hypothetical protein QTQ03_20220 [Micromonospora sp. WMMA1363]|uniref:hypothetical protein n=1 Tax=Micromonospora sp. WMMA1363 TaxID=3053985 RepID=UPI00259D0F75|nr:hypothetical protein [Micromonospora sp. WMMA1363]MDM4721807.1 hypothetical protein [Micromonospora sp. WMMA1363]
MRRHPKVEDDGGQLPGGGTVFGIGRRKTQAQLAKAELNQGFGHLRQAATYAAKGAGATVGPRVRAARGAIAPTAVVVRDRASSGYASTVAVLAPLALALRSAQAEAARKDVSGRGTAAAKQDAVSRKVKARNMKAARKKKSGRGSVMTGLLVAGAVAGMAGAMALRRRREQQEWAEYDPTRSLEPMRNEVDTIEVNTRTPAEKASTVAGDSPTTGTGASAMTGGSATAASGKQTPPRAADKVASAADGAKDSSGRSADDLTKVANRPNGRR